MVRYGLLGAGVLSTSLLGLAMFSARASGPVRATNPVPPASFAVCAACHSVVSNAPAKIGPNLYGIDGRLAGSQANFSYSPAMKASNIRWNREKLRSFVAQPRTVVPGTRMPFGGVQDKAKADEIVNYLLSLH